MSLEAAIRENTEAIRELIALRTEAIEKVTAAAQPATKAETAKKPASKADRQITESPEDRKPSAAEGSAAADPIKDAILGYIGAASDADERAARKAKVADLLAKVGAKKHSEVPAAKHKAFLNTIKKFVSEGDVIAKVAPADDEIEDEDEDDLLD